MFRQFIKLNRRLSDALTPPHIAECNVHHMFAKLAAQIVALPGTRRVLDAGAGAAWFFEKDFKDHHNLYLIGVDIEEPEMLLNDALDERHAADVCVSLPVEPGTVDAITAYSGVEHFPDNQAFLRNCYAALRPGGRLIAQFPGRYALFTTLNRLLPRRLARAVLYALVPGKEGELGFKAYYDRTNYSAFKRIAEAEGLEIEYHFPGYFDDYFKFFTPVFFFWQAFCILMFSLGIKDLATYNLFVLRKPGESDTLYTRPMAERKPHETPLSG